MKEHLWFVLKSVVVGLALGFLYLWFFGSGIRTATPVVNNPTFSYASAIQKITPSVVSIFIQSNELIPAPNTGISPRPPYVTKNYLGSGVIISENGHIVTNRHVINDARRVIVSLSTNEMFEASYVGVDEVTDLAVIKINSENLIPAQFADSDKLNTGDVVLAIGNPFGLNQSASLGIVSATGRRGLNVSAYENFIQTDAAINQGNSGGALINPLGEVVGISTASYNQIGAEGINFAIPANTTTQMVQAIIKYGQVLRGDFGIKFIGDAMHVIYGIAKPKRGIMVAQVKVGSTAHKQGVEARDVLTKINDTEINSIQDYEQKKLEFRIGEEVVFHGYNAQGEFVKTLTVENQTAP